MLVDEKFKMKQQYALAAQKSNYSGLHHSQQRKEGDCSPLLCPHEAPSEVLHPGLGLPAQERHRAPGAGPEEATKMSGGLEQLSYK